MSLFLEYSSWILAFLTLCGFLKFYIYYKRFGVYILRYLELSEILTLFMDNLISYLGVILPTSILTFILFKKCLNSIALEDYSALSETYFTFWWIPTITFSIVLIGVWLVKKASKKISNSEVWLQVIFSFFLIYFFPYLLIISKLILKNELHTEVQFRIIFFMGLSLVLIGISILFAFNEARKIKKTTEESIVVELDSGKLNGNYVVLGFTKNYMFFLERGNKSILIIPVKELKRITQFN